jgi:formylglycine-generating enzyme required for sulfatase activity
MKNLIIVFLILVGLQSCNTSALTIINGEVVSFKRDVPNGIFINDTLACDETEVAVIDYREYLHWTERTYGSNSQTYNKALPNTMIGDSFLSNFKREGDSLLYEDADLRERYFRYPNYNDYPIVGITYEQAVNYTNWRSDMVLQMMLLEAKLVKLHIKSDSSNCFTTARYAAGQYYNYKPLKNLYVPKFRLPTIEEWELCGQYKNGDDWGVDTNSKTVHKYKKDGSNLFLTKEIFLTALHEAKMKKPIKPLRIPYSAPVRSFYNNLNLFYNLIGNVAEMTATKGIAKGGSWFHTLSESKIKSNIPYQEQEAWLGFRNVCTWVKIN